MNKIINILKENKHDPTSATFSEYLYKYYISYNYSNRCFNDLSDELGIKPSILKSYIYSYAKNYLGKSAKEFDKYREEQRNKNNDLYLSKKNIILEKHGIETNFLWDNDEQKEIFLKDIYDYSSKYKFSEKSSKKMAEDIGITTSKYLYLVQLYMKDYLKVSKREMDKETNYSLNSIDRKRLNDPKNSIYKRILQSDNYNEINELVENSPYTFSILKNDFRHYTLFYSDLQVQIIIDRIVKFQKIRREEIKKSRYFSKENVKRKENLKIKEKAEGIVNKYIDSEDISIYEFFRFNNITIDEFLERVEEVKKTNKDLYEKYLEVSNYRKEIDEEALKDFENHLINGFESNSRIRGFDILDYYMFTNTPLSKMHLLGIDKFNKKAKDKLSKFKRSYKESNLDNVSEEYSFIHDKRYIVFESVDSNGSIKYEDVRELEDNEKELIIEFLRDNNLAVNRMTCNIALNRYKRGFLIENEEKKLVLNDK